MRLLSRQFWRLRGIESDLRRSEPQLAVTLALFARLAAGQAIISCEQACAPGNQVPRVLPGWGM